MPRFRKRFIASMTSLWCFAQFPDILLGMIFPRSDTKYRSVRGSKISMLSPLSAQKRQTFLRWKGVLDFGMRHLMLYIRILTSEAYPEEEREFSVN